MCPGITHLRVYTTLGTDLSRNCTMYMQHTSKSELANKGTARLNNYFIFEIQTSSVYPHFVLNQHRLLTTNSRAYRDIDIYRPLFSCARISNEIKHTAILQKGIIWRVFSHVELTLSTKETFFCSIGRDTRLHLRSSINSLFCPFRIILHELQEGNQT